MSEKTNQPPDDPKPLEYQSVKKFQHTRTSKGKWVVVLVVLSPLILYVVIKNLYRLAGAPIP